ncbi:MULTISPECIES: redoxin family protein [unclassified Chitinophaga]|uniref:redoxin family protein n=1 Tax=unclassified Chitinophaga TaxID=2619133 RepID=UPI0009FAC9E5|nr:MULTISPECIES: redoxin family protein [unclassified Chitinophaga]WPV69827.1 redoxin domain-containing protein [Chitinophaga sp. LS1]
MSRLLLLSLLITMQSIGHPHGTSFTERLKDYTGKAYDIRPQGKIVVYLFLSPECPLCRNYAPIVQQLSEKYKGVQFYGIISGRTFTKGQIGAYVKDFNLTFPVLIDTDKEVANSLKATVTPEALLVGSDGKEYYRGLIDDWITGLGTKRAKTTQLYLDQSIQNLVAGVPTVTKTTPIGCLISNY